MSKKASSLTVLMRVSLLAMLLGIGVLVAIACNASCILKMDKRMMDYCDALLATNTLRKIVFNNILSTVGLSSLISVFPAGYWLLKSDTRNDTKALFYVTIGALSLIFAIVSLFTFKSIIATLAFVAALELLLFAGTLARQSK